MALFCLATAAAITTKAAEVRHFSFAYDQPHTTAYGIAADTFADKLQELSHGTMIIDQFPGRAARPGTSGTAEIADRRHRLRAHLDGQLGDRATGIGVFSIHFVFRSEDHL